MRITNKSKERCRFHTVAAVGSLRCKTVHCILIATYLDYTAYLHGLTNRPSWKMGSINAEIVKWRSTQPWITSIQVNSKFEWRKAAQVNLYLYPNARLSSELFDAWKLSNKGITYLLILACNVHLQWWTAFANLPAKVININDRVKYRCLWKCCASKRLGHNAPCQVIIQFTLSMWYALYEHSIIKA